MDSRIRAGDLVLRFWTGADGGVIDDIVASSRAKFDSWLPGLASDLANSEAFIDRARRSACDGSGWYYCIEADGVVVGQCSIEPCGDATAEVGYWISSGRINQGLATRVVQAVYRPAAAHGFMTLVIHCDEGNVRSAALARNAGFTRVATVDLDRSLPRTSAQTGREMTWELALDGGDTTRAAPGA